MIASSEVLNADASAALLNDRYRLAELVCVYG